MDEILHPIIELAIDLRIKVIVDLSFPKIRQKSSVYMNHFLHCFLKTRIYLASDGCAYCGSQSSSLRSLQSTDLKA